MASRWNQHCASCIGTLLFATELRLVILLGLVFSAAAVCCPRVLMHLVPASSANAVINYTPCHSHPPLSSIITSRRLTVFGHLARMDENADASQAIFEPPPENWRRPPGWPHTTWMKNIHDDLSLLDLWIYEASDLAQNRPLCRLCTALSTLSGACRYMSCHWQFAVRHPLEHPTHGCV